MRERWDLVQAKGVEVLSSAGCGLESVQMAADSLKRLPRVNAVP